MFAPLTCSHKGRVRTCTCLRSARHRLRLELAEVGAKEELETRGDLYP